MMSRYGLECVPDNGTWRKVQDLSSTHLIGGRSRNGLTGSARQRSLWRRGRGLPMAYDDRMWASSARSRAGEVTLRTVAGFSADRCGIAAAGITYFALISIFPLALVALSVAGFVFSSEGDQDRLVDAVVERLPLDEGSGREDLAGVVTSIVAARGTLGLFGILSGIYTGSALFTAVRVALNGVFRAEKPRPFVLGKLMDIGMVLVFGALLVLSTGASFVLAFVGRIADTLVSDNLAGLVQFAMGIASVMIALLLSVGLFLLLYTRIPARPVRWKHAVPGAMLAALLFEALKMGFAQYAANFGNYNATYGSLSFVVLLLAFIYLTSQLTLLGAEAARATEEVAAGWPFPKEESRLRGVSGRLAKAQSMGRKWLGRRQAREAAAVSRIEPAPEQPIAPESLTSFVAHPETPDDSESLRQGGVSKPTRTRRRSTASWFAAGILLMGLIAAALGRARRKS